MRSNRFFFLVLILPVIFQGCGPKESVAVRSLVGEWEMTEVKSFYGTFEVDENGIRSADITNVVEEVSGEGFFTFTESTVVYYFVRNDTTYLSNGPVDWGLEMVSARTAGFSTPKYFLNINGDRTFEVIFGDQTRRSERNATEIKLIKEPEESGEGVIVELYFTKFD